MELNELLELVKPEWRKAFLRFIDTGEAEEPFMNYINADDQGQKAVEMAFDAQARAFEGLAKELSSDNIEGVTVPHPAAAGVSGDMARVVRDVLVLEPQVRQEVLQEAASAWTTRGANATVSVATTASSGPSTTVTTTRPSPPVPRAEN